MIKNRLLVFVWAVLLASCSTDVGNFQIGEDLVDKQSTILMTDSFSVKFSTVVMDSIATSDPTVALVGKYENDQIGTTELKHYFNFDRSSDISSILDNTGTKIEILDSLTLKLKYTGFNIGDTTQTFTIELHRLAKELELQDVGSTTDYLFNISSFPYDETPLATYSFTPYPNIDDSVEFRIDDTFAETLFEQFVNSADSVSSNEYFNSYLRGFVLVAPEANAVLGFDTDEGIQMVMYTHIVAADVTENEYDFDLTTENTNFNQSIADRTGSLFENLVERTTAVSSTDADGLAYTQGSTGVACRLDFPTINEVFTLEDHILIKAELILIPAAENNYRDLPSSLIFYTSNKTNKLGDNLTVTSSSGTETAVTATLVSNYLTGTFYYVADLSTYFLTELSDYYYDTNIGLLVMFPSTDWYNKSQLLLFSDSKVSQLSPKLNLYFLKNE
ncbi:DUF4270 family protein [Mangrovibacterium diazotrophicum]|uniref:Uncharacterized protein DUF4270 n=1 Tax=Mangrovibacterium diazotrophicum TaxID=1261403 RepID=A0A419W3N6_9BACT|nr:DUF4270 family protein [Mangrovibacterium diazotrophicum]RKD90095.1 uncharacterized protein DUF4270 [Mangrovibacterium diazotrophicum]